MDRELSKTQETERLIRLASQARAHISGEIADLKRQLDVPARLRSSLKSNPLGWLGGALGSGLAASLLFRGRRPATGRKPRSFPLAVAGLILTAARPLLKVWLTGQVKAFIGSQLLRTPLPRPSRKSTTS
jgi:hypothetical protein